MFRFTIRELVLLTIIVAMGWGWWVDHRRLLAAAEATHLEAMIAKLKATLAESRLNNPKWNPRAERTTPSLFEGPGIVVVPDEAIPLRVH